MSKMELLDQMMAWEDGSVTEEQENELFQALVNNGMAWSLQGMYGRQAMRLAEAGRITLPSLPPRAV